MKTFRILIAVLAWTLAGAASSAPHSVSAVGSIAIPVTDIDRSVAFYTEVLGFRVIADGEAAGDDYEHFLGVFGARVRVARLSLGEETIELLEFLAPRGRPLPADLQSNDRVFQHIAIIVRDMDEAYAVLRAHHVRHASTGPQVLPASNPNAGGIAAFYFRDPDGNFVEILHFPPGKGATRWQARDRLFLGIDHTAIVVADTEASLRFYRDLLGLSVAGTSDNIGTEQEHLNNVFGAHLRITALRAAAGPGIELLEYLTPRTGRPMPADSHANDAWYWQIDLLTPDPEGIAGALRRAQASFVSSSVVTLMAPALALGRGVIVRDPDGHALALATTR